MKAAFLFLCFIFSATVYGQLSAIPVKALNAKFSRGKWEILDRETLIKTVKQVRQRYGTAVVVLKGYTDSIGTEQYNTYLADFRLRAVEELMKELSVEVIEKKNYGERVEGKLEDNRRVVISFFEKSQSVAVQEENMIPEEESFKVELGVPQVLKIEFVSGKAEMMPYSYSEVDKLFFILSDFPQYDIELHGHVCCSDGYQISYARAQTVQSALMRKGISAERITIFGHSNKQPLVEEVTEEDMQRNRRVEAVFKER